MRGLLGEYEESVLIYTLLEYALTFPEFIITHKRTKRVFSMHFFYNITIFTIYLDALIQIQLTARILSVLSAQFFHLECALFRYMCNIWIIWRRNGGHFRLKKSHLSRQCWTGCRLSLELKFRLAFVLTACQEVNLMIACFISTTSTVRKLVKVTRFFQRQYTTFFFRINQILRIYIGYT